jgi:hypothetical protein
MRSITRVSLVIAASAALVGSLALPASAADTTATVEIEVGSLGISAPGGADLTTIIPGGSASAALVDVTVIDGRAGTGGWTASVTLTDFTGTTDPDNVIPASAATYTPAAADETGTSTVAPTTRVGLSTTPQAVQTATGVSGNNTAIWDASLSLLAPANALADTYEATLTHSVL